MCSRCRRWVRGRHACRCHENLGSVLDQMELFVRVLVYGLVFIGLVLPTMLVYTV